MKKRTSVLFGLLFAVIVIGGILTYTMLGQGEGTVAVISVDGEVLERIDLSKVRKPYNLEISTQYGHNTVHVERDAISVSEADCPDKVCVNHGPTDQTADPIVCLPNKLVVRVLAPGDDPNQLDGVSS